MFSLLHFNFRLSCSYVRWSHFFQFKTTVFSSHTFSHLYTVWGLRRLYLFLKLNTGSLTECASKNSGVYDENSEKMLFCNLPSLTWVLPSMGRYHNTVIRVSTFVKHVVLFLMEVFIRNSLRSWGFQPLSGYLCMESMLVEHNIPGKLLRTCGFRHIITVRLTTSLVFSHQNLTYCLNLTENKFSQQRSKRKKMASWCQQQ